MPWLLLFGARGGISREGSVPPLLPAAAAVVLLGGAAAAKAAYTMLSRPKPYLPSSEEGGASRTTMRRLVVVEPNEGDLTKAKMAVEEVPIPQPEWGQVLVRVAAAPINPSDYIQWKDKKGPTGHEGCGVVVASGGGMFASRLMGRKVGIILSEGRTCAEFVCCNAFGDVAPLDSVGDIENAASWFVNPVTAISLLETVRNKHKADVFIHTAAASQLGRMILKLIRTPSAPYGDMTVVNVVRRREQADLLRSPPLNAEHVVCTADDDWEGQLGAAIDKLGVRVAFDAVGGSITGRVVSLLPPGGICYAYGVLSGQTADGIPVIDLIYRNKRVAGYNLARDWLTTRSRYDMAIRTVSEGLKQRRDGGGGGGGWAESDFVDCTLDDAYDAFCRLRQRGVTGKKLRILMNPDTATTAAGGGGS